MDVAGKGLKYFRFGLRGSLNTAEALYNDYPMEARNINVKASQLVAINIILSNRIIDNKLIISNFQALNKKERGTSRQVLLSVLRHVSNKELIIWQDNGFNRSVIEYTNKILRYHPSNIVYHPVSEITTNIKGEGRTVAKVNTTERRELKQQLKAYWDFIKQHNIDPNITTHDFNIFNKVQVEVYGKGPLNIPERTDILPVIIFNDRDLEKGGRMFQAFWINMKKELRRGILIDGEKTADIDGKGMHVQLLYKIAGEPLPSGDLYIYTNEKRKITKGLMLLMMNTADEFIPEIGRRKVAATYRKRFDSKADKNELLHYIMELEGFHHKILPYLYKPNWGRLQQTEAAILLQIMTTAIVEDIVVLPVHDGCLCQRRHRDRVLQLFADQGIEAEENKDHIQPVPIEAAKELLEAHFKMQKAPRQTTKNNIAMDCAT